MDDLISRKALMEAFKEEFYYMYSDDFKFMLNWFENLPAVDSFKFSDQLWKIAYEHGKRDAQPTAEKKGTWVILYDGWAECSSCGEVGCIVGHLWKYCPYCGARMEENDG